MKPQRVLNLLVHCSLPALLGAATMAGDDCDADGVLDVGESGTLRITAENEGYAPLEGAVLRVAAADVEPPGGPRASPWCCTSPTPTISTPWRAWGSTAVAGLLRRRGR